MLARLPSLLSVVILALACLLTGPSEARAHGIYGHMHVTGWAVENMPEGELKSFLSEPEVFEALLYGAAFTDSGYWIQSGQNKSAARAYAEHSHWPPFVRDALQWVRTNDPPPFDGLESRKRVAFLMGVAAHGLQDEVFDSLFLYHMQEHDGAGQDRADPGTDGFLFLDDHVRMRPEEYVPWSMLLELYGRLDEPVDRRTVESAQRAMDLYLDERTGRAIGEGLGEEHAEAIPWARTHYLDPAIPGSLRAEIRPTMHYLEALWERLHDRWRAEDLVIHTYPAVPRRLLSHRRATPDAWVTFVFGRAVEYGRGEGAWVDEMGGEIGFRRDDTRWGGPGDWTRLATLKPTEDLVPGGRYTASLNGSLPLIGGQSAGGSSVSVSFQVACTEANADECPELEVDAPSLEPRDEADAGVGDVGMVDAGRSDVGMANTGVADGGAGDIPPSSDGGGRADVSAGQRQDESAQAVGCRAAGASPPPGCGATGLLLLVAGVAVRRGRERRGRRR